MVTARGSLLVSGLMLIACHSTPSQKPIHESALRIDGPPPPTSVAGFVHESSDVVRLMVVSVNPWNRLRPDAKPPREERFGVTLPPSPFWRPPDPTPWFPYTTVTGRILAVYRSSGQVAPGGTLIIRLDGGDTDRGDYIERVREPNVPDMEVGREYIVFMAGPTQPVGRHHGIFEVAGERLRAFSTQPETRALQELGTTGFLRQLGENLP